jgi:basic membrane protein A and related proteins
VKKSIPRGAALLLAAWFSFSTVASNPARAETKNAAAQPLKVGFLCVGAVSDHGWNNAHNQGRLKLEQNLSGQVQTTLAEKVPENAEAERVLERMVSQGNKLIFTTSYGFLDPALRVAKRHPNVTFMQVNRFQTAANLGTYFSHQYQPMYLAGMAAGKTTKSNKLGFIAAHPVPPLIQAINAFTLGARSVNPHMETKVVWINSWSDPAMESEAVKGLAESGVDVIAHAQDNQNAIMKACENASIYSVGFYSDAHDLAPKGWLTGACLDWAPLYQRIATNVIAKKWQPEIIAPGMEGGYIKLSSFGKAVSEPVKKQVLAKQKEMLSGKFSIFQGPLKDRKGKERLAAGHNADLKYLSEMDWFVPGVVGSLPKE